MLGKLLRYDMGALTRILAPLQAIALAVALAAAACGLTGYWVNEISIVSSGLEGIVEVLAGMGVLVGTLGLACLIPATLVIILYRYYTNLFTDQGYLTFTLPVRPSEILWSKVISGAVWLAISGVVTLASALLVSYAVFGFTSEASLSNTVPYWIISGDFDIFGSHQSGLYAPVALFLGATRSYIYLFAVLIMAFTGFTLGATWAKQHRVACGLVLFLGIWLGISMAWGTVTIVFASLIDAFLSDGSYASSQAVNDAISSLAQWMDALRNIIVCVGGFFICYVCLRKHVNLS